MSTSAYNSMFSLLDSIYPLSDELKQALMDSTHEVNFPRGTVLFKKGEIASNAFYVVTGMGRTYYYKEEKEITNNLCPENRIFISASSYYTGQPSYETGEVIEDSNLIVLPNQNLEKLCLQFMELNFVIRKLIERFYLILDQRTYFLHMKTARERYDFMMQDTPGFFLRVPLGQIASFLGMTQETLSRLRSNSCK